MALRISIDSTRNVDNAYDQYLMSREKTVIEAIRQFEDRLHHSYVKFGRFTIPGRNDSLLRSSL